MTMRGRNSVKALLSVDHTNALDGPVLLKEQQVSVHGPKLRSGWCLSCVINPFSRGWASDADRGQGSFRFLLYRVARSTDLHPKQ